MATISERPAPRPILAESSRRVQDPLHRLRRYIRRYVLAESLLVVTTCLAVCFWIGTLFDYGLFRLFGIDFVKDLPRWFRALGVGVALLAVFYFAEGIKALRTPVRPEQVGDRGREGLLVLLFSNRWLLAAVAAPVLIVYLVGWVCLAALVESKTVGMVGVGVLVFGIVLALVAFIVLKRLVYEFRPAALALVLERRYPDLLEDRLITAVELSDPKRAAEYGYSAAMVEETIHQAAAMVDRIRFSEVLRWSRLALWGVAAVLLTLGAYGLAWGGSMVVDKLKDRTADADRSLVELNDVVSIWYERNVLLDNEPWPAPGPAVVRPVGVDIKETLKGKKAQQLTGKNEAERRRYVFFWQVPSSDVQLLRESKVTVQAMSYEYIVYDRDVPDRWRELRVADLHSGHLDAGVDIDPRELPAHWRPMDYANELGNALRDLNARVVNLDEKARLETTLQKVNDLVNALVVKRDPEVKERLEEALGYLDALLTDLEVKLIQRLLVVRREIDRRVANLEEKAKERLETSLQKVNDLVNELVVKRDREVKERLEEALGEFNAVLNDLEEKVKKRLNEPLQTVDKLVNELDKRLQTEKPRRELSARAKELLEVDPREQLTIEEARFYSARWKPAGWRQEDLKERIDQALRRIGELLDDPRMARKLARRKQPGEVRFDTGSRSDRETYEVMKEKETEVNVYEHKVDVEDTTIPFAITADDYVSRTLRLYVWPRPRMEKVDYQTWVPAYLHHLPEAKGVAERTLAASVVGQVGALPGTGSLLAAATLPPERPYDDDQLFLAPRKQRLADLELNVANAGRPEIALPMSSDITLIARCNKPLDVFGAARVDKGKTIDLPVEPVDGDPRRFRVKLTNVLEPVELRFVFNDTDGDSGRQSLFITPTTDETPQIKLFQPDVLRMIEDKYLVTPSAVIPFKLVVSDDNGLSSLTYLYTLQEVSSQSIEARRATATAAAIGLTIAGSEAPLTSLFYNCVLPASLKRSEETLAGAQPVAHFKQQIEALRSGTLQDIEKELSKPLPRTRQAKGIREYAKKDLGDLDDYLRDNEAEVDKSKPFKGFNVGELQHREGSVMVSLRAPEGQLQKNFLMLLTLEVRDTNIYRPGRGNRLSSQQYPFLIVSDTELLFQISLEEQRLFDELQKSFAELEKARSQLSALRFDIPSMPGARGVDYVGFSVRAEEIDKTVRESLRVTTKVHADYDRILREMRTNRIHEGDKKQIVERVKDNIVRPLGKVKEGDFPYAQEATAGLRKVLDSGEPDDVKRLAASRAAAEAAEKEMDRVLSSLREVLVHMAGIVEINKLIATLRELEQREQNSLDLITKRKAEIEKSIFDQLEPKKDK